MESQGAEARFPVCKGADMAEDILHDFCRLTAVLPYPIAVVGIGTNGDDLTAQFLKSAQVFHTRKIVPAGIHAAGIELHTDPLLRQKLHDLIRHFPVIPVHDGLLQGIGCAFANIGQVTQHIIAIVVLTQVRVSSKLRTMA